MYLSVDMPEVEMHARGKNCEDDNLEVLQHAVVRILEEQGCEYIHHREK